MGEPEPALQTPFRSARQALYWAHEVEATDLTRVGKAVANMGGGSVPTARERLSPEEQHAQAAYVVMALGRGLDAWQMDVIRAIHLPRGSQERRERVERTAERVSEYLDRPGMPIDWVMETAATWFGDVPYRTKTNKHGVEVPWTARDWAQEVGAPETTLSGWKNGGKREQGIHDVLREWSNQAEGRAVAALRDSGLIP